MNSRNTKYSLLVVAIAILLAAVSFIAVKLGS